MIRVLFFILFFESFLTVKSQYMITKWFDGKKAAISFNFEGNHKGLYEIGARLIEDKKWKSTFFISTKTANWENVISMRKAGHEIGNHSHSNQFLISLNTTKVNNELLTSTQLISKYLPNYKVLSFSYPLGVGIGPGIENDSVREIISKYHIAATSPGTSGDYLSMRNAIPYHGYRNQNFHNFYYQLGTMVVKSDLSLDDFSEEVDLVIDSGDWLSLMYYSIGTTGREYVEEHIFESMLDSIQVRENDLWVAPFGDVIMYHQMRRSAKIEYTQVKGNNWVMYLTDDLDNNVYDNPLTIQVMKPIDTNVIKITQDGKKIGFHQDWSILQFNAIPDKGPIYITYRAVKVD